MIAGKSTRPIQRWISGALLSAALSLAAPAAPTVIFQTSFEASEGYAVGVDLVGQNGWLGVGSGGDGVVTNFFANQLQSAYIGFAAPGDGGTFHGVGYHPNFDPIGRQLPRVTFGVDLAVYASTTNHQGWFNWAVFNRAGVRLLALQFPSGPGSLPVYYQSEGGSFQATGQTFTNGVPYRLTVIMDFAANQWSASLGSQVLVASQTLATGTNTLSLESIDAQWLLADGTQPGDEFMVFDQFRLTAEPAPDPGVLSVFATSFEASEGYSTGMDLVGQNGWLGAGTGGDGIVTGFFTNQLQSAYIGFRAPDNGGAFHGVGYHPDFDPIGRQLPKVAFGVDLAVYASTTNNQGWFNWAVFNRAGVRLLALQFPSGPGSLPIYYQSEGGSFEATGQTFTNDVPYRLTVTMDFAANRWSASLDSQVLMANQTLATGTNTLSLQSIDAQWVLADGSRPGDEFMVFDEFQITAQAADSSTAEARLQVRSRSSDGQVNLRLTGAPGVTYAVEASADLRTWAPLLSLSSPDGLMDFTDTSAAGLNARFYRARR